MDKVPAKEAAFWQALERAPGDAATRQVFADWLEERGDARAALMRDPMLAPWLRPGEAGLVPALSRGLRWRQVRDEAVQALIRVGAPAVAPLLEVFLSSSGDKAQAAREALEGMRPEALLVAMPALLAEIGNATGVIVRLLTKLGPRAVAAVPRLVRLLQEGGRGNAAELLRFFGAVGPAAERAVPALIEHLPRSDWAEPDGPAGVGAVLAKIGPAGLGALIEAVRQRPPFWWCWLAPALRPFGEAPVAPLRELLASEDAYERVAAAVALYHWDAEAAGPHLADALRTGRQGVRLQIVAALARLGLEQLRTARPLLELAAADEDKEVRQSADAALARLR